VRRAAPERRSKQTWPVTPDSTASGKGFSRSTDEASNATLKSRLFFAGASRLAFQRASLFRRKLPARKLDAIKRPEGFDFAAQIFGKQILEPDFQHVGYPEKHRSGRRKFN